MRFIAPACAAGFLVAATPALVAAQTGGQDQELSETLRRLQERLDDLERRHQEDQQRIEQLENRLAEIEQRAPAPADGIPPAEETVAPPYEVVQPPPTSTIFGLSSGSTGGNLLNPELTVFIDTGFSISSRGENKALNRFNLREVELDLRAAISPSADGVLILALGEEIESSADGDVEIDRHVDIEEGYIDFHTLPWDLSLKIGKLRSAFGRNNLLHTHDLPQVTRPLAVTNFLGPEGLSTTGASLGWLVPNPWNKYFEATMELVNADGGAESPILGGPNAENPAALGHLKFFDDLTENSTLELGGSYLFAHTSNDTNFDANVFALDAAYQWIHPDPSKFRSFLLQGEAFWAANDIDAGFFGSDRNHSFGAYVFGQYQLNRDWYAGLRTDYSEFPNAASRGPDDYDFALSPYVTWYITEFLRVRLEYQHRMFEIDGSRRSEEAVLVQFTGVVGAHPPHPYWVRR